MPWLFFFISFVSLSFLSLPLPRVWGSTAASRSWGSAAGHTPLGISVCGAACTCCRAPPLLWPPYQCCGRTRSASSGHGRRIWSTEIRRESSRWSHYGANVKDTAAPADISDALSKDLMTLDEIINAHSFLVTLRGFSFFCYLLISIPFQR